MAQRRQTLTEIAYPRLSLRPTESELKNAFTPDDAELALASHQTRQPSTRLALLIRLKTFQRLGRFVAFSEIPPVIIRHIAATAGLTSVVGEMKSYDASKYMSRLTGIVRQYMNVKPYDAVAANIAMQAAWEASCTRDDVPDIINAAIEDLFRHRYELPELSTLERAAKTMRSLANRTYHRKVAAAISAERKVELDVLLRVPPGDRKSAWDRVKAEPLRPTQAHLHQCISQVRWLREHVIPNAFAGVPDQKIRQFAAEGRALDAFDISKIPPFRRYTLMAAVLRTRLAENMDGMAAMYIRLIQGMHNSAKRMLAEQKAKQAAQTDELVALLRQTTLTWVGEPSVSERDAVVDGMLRPNADDIIAKCDAHAAVASNNHIPFLAQLYGPAQRPAFFKFIEEAHLASTSNDRSFEHAIDFILQHKNSRKRELDIGLNSTGGAEDKRVLDLSFVPDRWWPVVTGQRSRASPPEKIDRHGLEICVFSLIMNELKSCDLCIPGSIDSADYRTQMISQEECARLTPAYAEQAGFPATASEFVADLQQKLHATAVAVDGNFPDNHHVTLVNGKPKVERIKRLEHAGAKQLTEALNKEMPEISIVRPFIETEQWVNWTRTFGPITGFDAKLDRPAERYLTTVFGYGCGLGPTQTARSVKGVDRKQLAFVNARHITEQDLDDADRIVAAYYARLSIHRHWGTGQSASADGMKWDIHPQALMTEFHVRYGGYGGIGYYLVSDTYLALFSRFIACGAYEGHNILDFIHEAQKSPFQPDTVHSDSHGQNTAIFALAYLLGIKLMPRIKDWKDLDFCRADSSNVYDHIDPLFNASVDWELINAHFSDMMRVALSIKAGRMLPSTILRRLATYSRKNKLYHAFDQLGRVIRTIFLLQYMDSIDMRRMIGVATNKGVIAHSVQ